MRKIKGYQIIDKKITFTLYDKLDAKTVFVSGNFNGWTLDNSKWQMSINEEQKRWELVVANREVKNGDSDFFEFTFVVDGARIDADKEASNIFHCIGHGYRYTIPHI